MHVLAKAGDQEWLLCWGFRYLLDFLGCVLWVRVRVTVHRDIEQLGWDCPCRMSVCHKWDWSKWRQWARTWWDCWPHLVKRNERPVSLQLKMSVSLKHAMLSQSRQHTFPRGRVTHASDASKYTPWLHWSHFIFICFLYWLKKCLRSEYQMELWTHSNGIADSKSTCPLAFCWYLVLRPTGAMRKSAELSMVELNWPSKFPENGNCSCSKSQHGGWCKLSRADAARDLCKLEADRSWAMLCSLMVNLDCQVGWIDKHLGI